MSNNEYRNLVKALSSIFNNIQPKSNAKPALLGDGQGNVLVANRPNFSWVRIMGDSSKPLEVFGIKIDGYEGMPVVVGELPWLPGLTQVIDVDWRTFLDTSTNFPQAYIAKHGQTHHSKSSDPADVDKDNLRDLNLHPLPTSGSWYVEVNPDFYHYGLGRQHFAGGAFDVTPYATGSSHFITVYIEGATNTLKAISGPNWPTLANPGPYSGTFDPFSLFPTPPIGAVIAGTVMYDQTQPNGIPTGGYFADRILWTPIGGALITGTSPVGLAGGDLAGSYPNPTIALGAVATNRLANLAVTAAKIANATITDAQVAAANIDGLAAVPSLRTLGTGTQQAAGGSHSHGPSGAPLGAAYVTIGNDATLTNERALTNGIGLALADGGINSSVTLSVDQAFAPTWTGKHIFGQAPNFTGFTAGSVLFAGPSGILSQDNTKLFWDNSTKQLGIGTAAPAAYLHIVGSNYPHIQLDGSSTGTATIRATSDGGFQVYSSPFVSTGYAFDLEARNGIILLETTYQAFLGDQLYNSNGVYVGADVINNRIVLNAPSIDQDLTGGLNSLNLFNAKPTTINFAGAATTIGIGANGAGTMTLKSAIVSIPNTANINTLNVSGLATLNGGLLVSGTSTFASMTPGSVLFAGPSGIISQNNPKLLWDNTNFRLGINNNVPTVALDVWGSLRVTGSATVLGSISVGTATISAAGLATLKGTKLGWTNYALVDPGGKGDYTTIGAALAAVTSPSVSNQWYIEVLSGSYAESFTVPVYTTLHSYSRGGALLTGAARTGDMTTLAGENSTIDGFHLIDLARADNGAAAVINTGGRILNSVITWLKTSGAAGTLKAVLIVGNPPDNGPTLDNVAIWERSDTASDIIYGVISTYANGVTLKDVNVYLIPFNAFGSSYGIACGGLGGGGGSLTLVNCQVTHYPGNASTMYDLYADGGTSVIDTVFCQYATLGTASGGTIVEDMKSSATIYGLVRWDQAITWSAVPTFSTMTLGSVLFAGAAGLLSQNNTKLFWDNTNFRLGIGNGAPAVALDVTGNITASGAGTFGNLTPGSIVFAGTGGLLSQDNTNLFWDNTQKSLTSGNRIEYSLSRTLPTVVNTEVDIGTFNLLQGSATFWISVQAVASGFTAAKAYILSLTYNSTNALWVTALPISSTGPVSGNDFALDVYSSDQSTVLRLRRVSGSTAATAYVVVSKEGFTTTFTPSTATAAVTAPTAYFNSTLLTQVAGALVIPTNVMLGDSIFGPGHIYNNLGGISAGGIAVEESTTNLVPNPSFEIDTSGYAAVGARTTAAAYFGSYGVEVVNPAQYGAVIVSNNIAVVGSTTYTWSFYVKGTQTANYHRFIRDETNNVNISDGQVALAAGVWTRGTVTFTTASNTANVTLHMQWDGVAAVTVDIDGMQLEAKPYATNYVDGTLGPAYGWTGTAHASSSTRQAGAFVTDNAGVIHGLGVDYSGNRASAVINQGGSGDILQLFNSATKQLSVSAAGVVNLTAQIQSSNYASQVTGWSITPAGAGDLRYLYADEMHVKSIIADLQQALAGGQIISKSVAEIASDFTVPALGGIGTLVVKDLPSASGLAVFVSGDIVRLQQFSRPSGGTLTITDAWGVVTAYVNNANGTQNWTFTRSTGATGGGATGGSLISSKTLALDYGTTGNGFYEVNAIDGVFGANSPYAQIVTWSTHPQSGKVVRTRMGQLTGITSVNEYGLYAGDGAVAATNKFVRISDFTAEIHNLPLRLYEASTLTMALEPSGPYLALGNPMPTGWLQASTTGIWMGNAGSSIYKLRIGTTDAGGLLTAGLTWSGTTLNIIGGGTFSGSLSAATGTFAGSLSAATGTFAGSLTAGSGTITGDLAIGTGGDIRSGATAVLAGDGYWLAYNAGTPVLRVGTILTGALAKGLYWDGSNIQIKAVNTTLDASGNLTATSVTLTGSITATSGAIAGWTVSATRISNSVVFIDNAGSYISLGTTPPTAYGSNVGIFIEGANTGRLSIYKDANNYFQWDSSKLIWHAANTSLDTSGNLTATSATLTGAITATSGAIGGWTVAASKISATGIDIISGGSAGLAFGATPPTSATAGTGLWLDRTGLFGLVNSVLQTKIDAVTGAITASFGNIVLDSKGITGQGLENFLTLGGTSGGSGVQTYRQLQFGISQVDTGAGGIPFGTIQFNDGNNLLVNGSFDSGDFTGWTATAFAVQSSTVRSGSFAALGTSVIGASILETATRVAVTAGVTYVASGWMAINGTGAGNAEFKVLWYTTSSGGSILQTSVVATHASITGGPDWQYYTASLTAPASATYATVYFDHTVSSGSAALYVDAVSFSKQTVVSRLVFQPELHVRDLSPVIEVGLNVGTATGAPTGEVRASQQFSARINGSGGGFFAGTASDVQLYRSAASLWRTPHSLTIDVGLNVGTATGAATGEIKTSGVLTIGTTVETLHTDANRRLYLKTAGANTENLGQGIHLWNGTNTFGSIGGLDLSGKSFIWLATNRYYSGTAWTDLSAGARPGGYLQITNDVDLQFLYSAAASVVQLNRLKSAGVNGDLTIGAQLNGQQLQILSVTELTTIAAAATTDTGIQIPINATLLAVSVRVVTVIPTAANFNYALVGGLNVNTAAVSTAAGSTDQGTQNAPTYNGNTRSVRITPNLTPAANTGQVRVTIHYMLITPPTS